MKNQYFGDVNDYRKYGLLRLLGGEGLLRIGVCWMLTPNDTRPDGEKTQYLDDQQLEQWRHYDPPMYDFLRRKVHGHETEPKSRDIKNLTSKQLPNASFFTDVLKDAKDDRKLYFETMWERFAASNSQLIFFDPDDGLANNNSPKTPLKKGRKNSSKKLFRDEVQETLQRGFSVLLYQHFDRTNRSELVERLGTELAEMPGSSTAYSFWTPHVLFLLAAHSNHQQEIEAAVTRVSESSWCQENSAPTSKSN